MTPLSEQTCEYWIDTLMGWAEARLAPPQLDECKRAWVQVVETAHAAGAAAMRETAVSACRERAAELRANVTLSIVGDMYATVAAEADWLADAIAALPVAPEPAP